MIITYTNTKVRHGSTIGLEGGGETSREAEKQRSAGIRNNGIIRDRGGGVG